MAVFSLSSVYRLLGIVIVLFLCEVCTQDQPEQNSSNGVRNKLKNHQVKDITDFRSSRRQGRIEASIVPVVNSDKSGRENHHSSRVHSKAEVRVLVPTVLKNHNPHANGLIRASSILMEYDEDTRKYIYPNARKDNHEPHRIRHNSHKHLAPIPLSDDYFAANDAPLDEVDSVPLTPKDSSDDPQTLAPVRRPIIVEDLSNIEINNFPKGFLRESHFSPAPKRHQSDKSRENVQIGTATGVILKPRQKNAWLAFHTPTRIYIPVRYDGSSENIADTNCVQCSSNMSVTAPRLKTRIEVPVPAVSVCYRYGRGVQLFTKRILVGRVFQKYQQTFFSSRTRPVELTKSVPSRLRFPIAVGRMMNLVRT
ncbi:uncharacterized protein NPIL_642151 [Nephila pilipes]|uniref:Uncharacterized protein n=1 Tax=Nephila pilipes TaxID=299642 RepID=A0A8X6PSB1_NEPPI|nr:uncharacterized protein NPIL_642151 [Nephila pilipes]